MTGGRGAAASAIARPSGRVSSVAGTAVAGSVATGVSSPPISGIGATVAVLRAVAVTRDEGVAAGSSATRPAGGTVPTPPPTRRTVIFPPRASAIAGSEHGRGTGRRTRALDGAIPGSTATIARAASGAPRGDAGPKDPVFITSRLRAPDVATGAPFSDLGGRATRYLGRAV